METTVAGPHRRDRYPAAWNPALQQSYRAASMDAVGRARTACGIGSQLCRGGGRCCLLDRQTWEVWTRCGRRGSDRRPLGGRNPAKWLRAGSGMEALFETVWHGNGRHPARHGRMSSTLCSPVTAKSRRICRAEFWDRGSGTCQTKGYLAWGGSFSFSRGTLPPVQCPVSRAQWRAGAGPSIQCFPSITRA